MLSRRAVLAAMAGGLAAAAAVPFRAAAVPPRGFVQLASGLTVNGDPWRMHSATTYGRLGDVAGIVALARQAKLNTLELVEFEYLYRDPAELQSERTWHRVDQLLAQCRTAGLKVLVNFSSYGHTRARQGIKPATHDWGPYLRWVMSRVNTVNGVRYRDDPTIAKIELYAEIAAPNYSDPMRGTTAETTEFYRRTLAQLRQAAPNHLISTGGFSYLNDPNSGIDWRTIMAGANNQVCDVEVNSWPDRDVSLPAVRDYAAQLGKPWQLTAFSAGPGQPSGSWDCNHYPDGDPGMAGHFEDMYARSVGSAGRSFWNLGQVSPGPDVLDIGPQYPQTFATVQRWGP